jgi:hypothetical protein
MAATSAALVEALLFGRAPVLPGSALDDRVRRYWAADVGALVPSAPALAAGAATSSSVAAFELGGPVERLRLVLAEWARVSVAEAAPLPSELLDAPAYLADVVALVLVAYVRLPAVVTAASLLRAVAGRPLGPPVLRALVRVDATAPGALLRALGEAKADGWLDALPRPLLLELAGADPPAALALRAALLRTARRPDLVLDLSAAAGALDRDALPLVLLAGARTAAHVDALAAVAPRLWAGWVTVVDVGPPASRALAWRTAALLMGRIGYRPARDGWRQLLLDAMPDSDDGWALVLAVASVGPYERGSVDDAAALGQLVRRLWARPWSEPLRAWHAALVRARGPGAAGDPYAAWLAATTGAPMALTYDSAAVAHLAAVVLELELPLTAPAGAPRDVLPPLPMVQWASSSRRRRRLVWPAAARSLVLPEDAILVGDDPRWRHWLQTEVARPWPAPPPVLVAVLQVHARTASVPLPSQLWLDVLASAPAPALAQRALAAVYVYTRGGGNDDGGIDGRRLRAAVHLPSLLAALAQEGSEDAYSDVRPVVRSLAAATHPELATAALCLVEEEARDRAHGPRRALGWHYHHTLFSLGTPTPDAGATLCALMRSHPRQGMDGGLMWCVSAVWAALATSRVATLPRMQRYILDVLLPATVTASTG